MTEEGIELDDEVVSIAREIARRFPPLTEADVIQTLLQTALEAERVRRAVK